MITHRRRSFVSKPTFQLKLTIIFMLMVTIVANLVGGICYLLISEKVQDLLEKGGDRVAPELTMRDIANFLIPRILVAEGFSLCFVFLLSILVTHTIAGPVYRMEKIAKEVGTGNLAIVTTLRPRDELKELADAFNVMTRGLAEKISAVQIEVVALEKACEGKGDFTRVKELLQQFRLPEHLEVAMDDEEELGEEGGDAGTSAPQEQPAA
ncbi:MAG: HAMP domain-containing protein [Candidatus Riflebacteria bacterium]|nr:HAMP domain-containing protein [Candidatus Riflebacteria bacterium]